MHNHRRPPYSSAVRIADALVSQTYAERRDVRAEGADDFIREPGFARRARPRRDQDALRRQRPDLLNGDAVIAMHLQFYLHFPQVLHQVVGK